MAINFSYWKTRVVRYPLLCLSACAALFVTGLTHGLGKSDWAAWVQAVGSILAIIVAFWIAQAQQRKTAKLEDDRCMREQFQKTVTLCTLANWAISAMKRALEHAETGGAHGTSAFNPGRLDHERELLQKFVTPTDPQSSAFALSFIHALWEVRQNFDEMCGGTLRDYYLQLALSHIQQCERQLILLIHRKSALEAECTERGIVES